MFPFFNKKPVKNYDSDDEYAEQEAVLGFGNNLAARISQQPTTIDSDPSDGIVSNNNNLTDAALQVFQDLGISRSNSTRIFYTARTVSSSEEVYTNICNYVRNSQEHGYGMQVKNIVRLVRHNDFEFQHMPDCRDNFRMMLWHGTKPEVIASILEHGFRLPKPKQQMFGPGIYFADRTSKSANYCFDYNKNQMPKPGSSAFLLLCDVMLGNVYNAKNPQYKLNEPPAGFRKKFHSVMCTGRMVPDRCLNKEYKKCILPCGPTIPNTKFPSYTVSYNEYIVYDTDKIKIPFLVEIEFKKTPVKE